jgi:hypothetical protein
MHSRRAGESEKSWDKWETLYCAEGEEHFLLEGSQASPACPYDKGSVEVKTLKWLEAVS